MNNEKQNKNKIIIAVSVIIIFIIIVSVGFYFLIKFLNNKVEEEKNRYKNPNEIASENNETIIDGNYLGEPISNETIIDDPTKSFDKGNGKIEIVWIDNNNNLIEKPLEPVLGGLNKVRYNRDKAEFDVMASDDKNWYDYSKKQWANAIDENGNYFVWIPRYAYKIVYYSDKTYNKIIGYTDARGVLKVNDDGTLTRVLGNNSGLKEVGNHYIVHPAFMNDYTSVYQNSGWDDNISGIWISKFEASLEMNGQHVETENEKIGNVNLSDSIKLSIKPGKSSWRNISIGNAYNNGYNYNRQRESHMLKNIEWGAIAYLSYSKYGINAGLVGVNTSTNYITGDSLTPSEVFNNKKNESSNKNETGIYDLVGGAAEFVAAYINNGNQFVKQFGKNMVEDSRNSKYKTLYKNDPKDDGNSMYDKVYANSNFVLNALLRGDALFETSNNGYGNSSWDTNSAFFVQQDVPFFIRGGDIGSGAGAGLFYYNASNGQPNGSQGYRIALVCK